MPTPSKLEQNIGRKRRFSLPGLLRGTGKLLLAIVIVVAAVAAYRYQMRTSPRAGRKKPPRQAKLVQVIPVHREDCVTTVIENGVVVPAQQVTLQPQVTGRIVEISDDVVPGSIVRTGQKLMAIDRRDYDILVKQRHSDVVRATKDLKIEQGNQAIAKQEYELLGEVVTDQDKELVLRQPQLASAQSALESAQAALDKARLDLARCDIVAPFNAIVLDKHIDLGAAVGTNSRLVTLIGTDQAWIEVKVQIDQLKWLNIPQRNGGHGSSMTIHNPKAWGPDRFRTGRVLCLYGQLETAGQMAQLLVAVDDPFCLRVGNHSLPQLLMGSYVSAEIQGRTLPSVFPVNRSYLRDGDTLWIMDEASQLEIRRVKVAFRGYDRVYVTEGVAENEQLVVTDIAAPVAGMPLRVARTKDGSERRGGTATGERQRLVSGQAEGGQR